MLGLLLAWLFVAGPGSRPGRLSSCGSQGLEHRLSRCGPQA